MLLIMGLLSDACWIYPRRLFAKRMNSKTAHTTPAFFAGIPQVSLAVMNCKHSSFSLCFVILCALPSCDPPLFTSVQT
ncbi:hypothetical protein I7I48_11260 [Histoplasma ohiense]|nr:hypothetical protein I7I48_11260 [Histoplasma ohiense (nom. inval.)]